MRIRELLTFIKAIFTIGPVAAYRVAKATRDTRKQGIPIHWTDVRREGESEPPPCDQEIYWHGQYVAALYGRSPDIEEWVRSVAKQTGARLDWHYAGGRARVLYLGDAPGKSTVIETMNERAPQLRGRILDIEVVRNEGEE